MKVLQSELVFKVYNPLLSHSVHKAKMFRVEGGIDPALLGNNIYTDVMSGMTGLSNDSQVKCQTKLLSESLFHMGLRNDMLKCVSTNEHTAQISSYIGSSLAGRENRLDIYRMQQE